MPTILKIGPYRFFFFSEENGEPAHVHVIREEMTAKFWVVPNVSLACNNGFPPHELRRILRLVVENREMIENEWNKRRETR
jgi:hypothetical protein